MEDKEYINRLTQSVAQFLKEEALRGVTDNQNHKLMYRFGEIDEQIELENINKKEKIYPRPIHELVTERIESTNNEELTDAEINLLYKDIEASTNFSGRNMIYKRYREALQCAQRTIDDIKVITRCMPDIAEGLEVHLGIAERTARKAKMLWQNPETGYVRLDIEDYIAKGHYEMAAHLRDQLKEAQPKIE
jgi:hypothetical protein